MDDHLNFDPESPDAAELDGQELDLTPRVRDNEKRGSRTLPTVIIVGVLVVVGFVLFQGLSGATLSIQTADTAVAERSETGERRFRITGSPIAVTDEDFEVNGQTAVRFSIACDGAVARDGEPDRGLAVDFEVFVGDRNWRTGDSEPTFAGLGALGDGGIGGLDRQRGPGQSLEQHEANDDQHTDDDHRREGA